MERVLVVGARCRMKGGSASPSAGRSGGGVRKCERHARLVKVVTSAAVEARLVLEASLKRLSAMIDILASGNVGDCITRCVRTPPVESQN